MVALLFALFRESAMKRIFVCLAALFVFAACAHAAGIIVPAEERYHPWTGVLPACDDAGVVSRISDRFAQRETEFWNSPIRLAGFDRVREIGYRANGVAYIPRRYCIARSVDGDGKFRPVIYNVGEDLGVIGWGYGVEWCVIGLDRNHAYEPACRVLKPFVTRYLGQAAIRARY
jgi:hypothetical protein